MVEFYEERRLLRKRRIKDFKRNWILNMQKKYEDDNEFDSKHFENKFDYLNKDLMYNSDLEKDNAVLSNFVNLPKIKDEMGISYDNDRKNKPI